MEKMHNGMRSQWNLKKNELKSIQAIVVGKLHIVSCSVEHNITAFWNTH